MIVYAALWGHRVSLYLDRMRASDRDGLTRHADWCEAMAVLCARQAGSIARLVTRI